MGRRRQPPSGGKSPQSTNPDSGMVTRSRSRAARSSPQSEAVPTVTQEEASRSRAARSVTSPQSEAAPTLTQEEASGSPTARKRLCRFSPPPRGRRKEFLAQASASTPGEEEVDPVTKSSVAPAARDSMEDDAAAGVFVPHSPIRRPYLVEYDSDGDELEPSLSPDPALSEAYEKAMQQYSDKIGQLLKLPTLDKDTCIDSKDIEESSAETILKASKFILGLSSYIGGVLLKDCSGILMEWSNGTGTILTTADLICSESPNLDVWLGEQKYALDAEVRVKLLHKDDIEVEGKLTYLDKQYGFALISARMDPPRILPHFSNELRLAGDIFLLGRDKWDLQVGGGKVLNKCAGSYQHHHYMYYDGDIFPCGFGGAVIDLEGDVIGMITSSIEFIHSSTILKCLHLWRTFSFVPRIHLGMKLFGTKCLNLASKEKISRKCGVDAGLIVMEVSGESNAEKLGVRMGDIVQAVNGKCIDTTIQLENMLLDLCKDCLEKGIGFDSDVDVTVVLNVFNTIEGDAGSGRIQLIAKLSRDVEIIKTGKYIVSNRDFSTSMSQSCSR